MAIEKTYDGKLPITSAMLTLEGREALQEHWDRLERIRQGRQGATDSEGHQLISMHQLGALVPVRPHPHRKVPAPSA